MAKGIIVMTAMPPTKGHGYLIDFARTYMSAINGSSLHVIICSRPYEPIDGDVRAQAIADHFRSDPSVWVHHRRSSDPQLPENHPDFWSFWKNIVVGKINDIDSDDILFASDRYGVEFAKKLGCKFIPCDPDRSIVDISATKVRMDPIKHFDDILPEFSQHLQKTVTFFGAESTGKTEMSRSMSDQLRGHWCHEWARPYLETCGAEVTDEKMNNIVYAQFAAQKAVAKLSGRPFTFQDTDLLSTIGYYRIYGGKPSEALERLARSSPSHLYIVMNSNIPFTPDALRYGGDRRESKDQFWIDLLDEFGRPYHYVKETEHYAQSYEVRTVLMKLFHGQTDWSWFKRENA